MLQITINVNDEQLSKVSDGHHTFGEIYAHRHALFCALLTTVYRADHSLKIFKTKKSLDGKADYENWFIAGFSTAHGQITYHLPLAYWDLLSIPEIDCNEDYDGHTSDDVLQRLFSIYK